MIERESLAVWKKFPINSFLTSLIAGPTLQSQTGFGGCDAVGSDSPIKRNPACAGLLETGRKVLIPPKDEHFLLFQELSPDGAIPWLL
jgi:hypothetical protein